MRMEKDIFRYTESQKQLHLCTPSQEGTGEGVLPNMPYVP